MVWLLVANQKPKREYGMMEGWNDGMVEFPTPPDLPLFHHSILPLFQSLFT